MSNYLGIIQRKGPDSPTHHPEIINFLQTICRRITTKTPVKIQIIDPQIAAERLANKKPPDNQAKLQTALIP
jgi:hypothetical protein